MDYGLFLVLEIILIIEGIAALIILGLILRYLFGIPRNIFDLPERLTEIVISIITLAFFSPILMVLKILFTFGPRKLRGPLFYTEVRCGVDNKPFKFCKLRTMVNNAKELSSQLRHKSVLSPPLFYIPMKDDGRIHSKIGYLLKKTAIDEIPVLINVLKGNMSLVGPRPLNFEELKAIKNFSLDPNIQKKRSSLKPGFVSLWDTYVFTLKSGWPPKLEKNLKKKDEWIKEWMAKDLAYIEKRSTSLDIKTLLSYIPTIIMRFFLPIEEITSKEKRELN